MEACRLRLTEVCVDDTVVGRFHDRRLQLLRWILLLLLLTDGEKAATLDLKEEVEERMVAVTVAMRMEDKSGRRRLLRCRCRCCCGMMGKREDLPMVVVGILIKLN